MLVRARRRLGTSGLGSILPPVGIAASCGAVLLLLWTALPGLAQRMTSRPPTSNAHPGYVAVSVGSPWSCALRRNRRLRCWGSPRSRVPRRPEGYFASVSAGDLLVCGLHTHGRLRCWGNNSLGELRTPRGVPPGQRRVVRGLCASTVRFWS